MKWSLVNNLTGSHCIKTLDDTISKNYFTTLAWSHWHWLRMKYHYLKHHPVLNSDTLCTTVKVRGPFNSPPPGQNGCQFTDNIFKCIFMNKSSHILIWNSQKFVPQGLVDNKSTLVQVMAWHQTSDKSLPEAMLPTSLVHICGTMERSNRVKQL